MTRLCCCALVLAGMLLLEASHALSLAGSAQSGKLAHAGRIGDAWNRKSDLTLVASAGEAQWRRPGRSEAPAREQPAIKSAKVAFSTYAAHHFSCRSLLLEPGTPQNTFAHPPRNPPKDLSVSRLYD